jgi:hypothetical protein
VGELNLDLTLAPPATSVAEQTLDPPKLYTSARRFRSPPPSLVPPRPPEMERGGEIAAGTRFRLALTLGNCSWERVRERGCLSGSPVSDDRVGPHLLG